MPSSLNASEETVRACGFLFLWRTLGFCADPLANEWWYPACWRYHVLISGLTTWWRSWSGPSRATIEAVASLATLDSIPAGTLQSRPIYMHQQRRQGLIRVMAL